jgi:hypothetical protein
MKLDLSTSTPTEHSSIKTKPELKPQPTTAGILSGVSEAVTLPQSGIPASGSSFPCVEITSKSELWDESFLEGRLRSFAVDSCLDHVDDSRRVIVVHWAGQQALCYSTAEEKHFCMSWSSSGIVGRHENHCYLTREAIADLF